MRFRVDRDVLADAVAWTARTLPSRPSVPVLAGIRMQADDALNVSSFDYEVSAEVSLPVTTAEPGTTLVSGRLLAEITRSLPDRPVEVATDGSKVVLTCGSATFTLLTMPVEDYPALPEMPPPTGSVGSDAFATAVTQVAIAAGRDDTLPVLTGVRVEIDGNMITLASTDRYRLAVRELHWNPRQPDIDATALVPARTLADTARSLTSGAEVSIALGLRGQAAAVTATGEGMIGFEGGGRRTTTRLLDGEFPKFRSLLPDQVNAVAELPTSAFTESVKRVSLVAERSTPVRLSFSAGQLFLEAGTGDEAQAVETLEASLDGDDIQIAFNPQYLLDGLSAIDSDTARLSFTIPTKPAVITGKPAGDDPGQPDYRYLLMPIRPAG
ncbi:MAG TPA: DNA polymerase III subunit beta [Streptosporangiaceae bacterium]|nr:DNA polymerase III subunit beta [Streptosporangiaceae bacterium]